MRTTVELPVDLMREAKARASRKGETLKEFFTRAIAAEIGREMNRVDTPSESADLPTFGTSKGRRVRVSNADIARFLAADDVMAARPQHPRRR